ncbi:MAG: hypothetical protein GXO74_01090 [Calditrichaeota bacterium]|nr:hypothetical protein [Calditrichota bacterium]
MEFDSIITHNDLDGIVSAAICSSVFGIDRIKFAGPNNIANAEITITSNDIVCDLPYPLECGLWFDHHEGNLEELRYRNIDVDDIPGKFDLQPSCARVIFNYFNEQRDLPEYFDELVRETDIIDSFQYASLEDWQRETPAKIIDSTIRLQTEPYKQKLNYLRKLIFLLRDNPIQQVIEFDEILQRYQNYLQEEENILQIIRRNSNFLEQDKSREIIILDLSGFSRPPRIIKNLAYLLYPEALCVLEIRPIFRRQIKTTDLGISLSLSINLNNSELSHDSGEIMRELNLGDGHAGAAGGTIRSKNKAEMLKNKTKIINEIFKLWQNQK